jgi:hypothetical protein
LEGKTCEWRIAGVMKSDSRTIFKQLTLSSSRRLESTYGKRMAKLTERMEQLGLSPRGNCDSRRQKISEPRKLVGLIENGLPG